MNDIELYHHGVKGMKWGVRRTQEQLGRSERKKDKKHQQIINSRSASKLYKHRGELTDEELKRVVERLDMEKRLKDLNHKEVSYGQKVVLDILGHAGKIAVTTGVVYVGTKYAKKKVVNSDTFKDAVKLMKNINEKKETIVKTAEDVSNVAKKMNSDVKKAAHDTRLNVSKTKGARAYVKTVNSLIKKLK